MRRIESDQTMTRFLKIPGLRSCLQDERGSAAIMVGLSLTALVGAVGIGVEIGSWYAAKRQLQTAADAAAMGAAYEMYQVGDASSIQAAAEADAAKNDVVPGGGVTVAAVNPPSVGKFVGNNNAVQVTISQQPSLMFSALFQDSVTLTVRAVSEVKVLGEACVLSLSPTAPIGIQLAGSANLNLDGCGMFSNATSATSMTTAGGAQLQVIADYFAMVGGYQANGSAVPVLDNGDPLTGQTSMADPFADKVQPIAPGSTYADPTFGNGDTWEGTGAGNAAYFDEGLTFGSQADVTIPSSVTEIYVKGDLKINAGAVVNCTCTFILTDADSKVTINGNATVNVTAPSADGSPTPRYGGISFYNASPTSNTKSSFSGTGSTNIQGAIYFPNQEIDYRGTSNSGAKCTRIVANNIVFIGDTSAQIQPNAANCPKMMDGVDMIAKSVPVLVE
jgi:Flp pilus assembly protein TadG